MSHARTLSATLIGTIAALALAAQYIDSLSQNPGLDLLQNAWRLLRYFTILTNLLVAVTFLGIGCGRLRPGAGWMTALTLWIALVSGVYHVLLAGDPIARPLGWWADFGLHSLVPALVGLWWLIWAPRARLGQRHAALWLIWPLTYVGYAMARAQAGDAYPYFFLDPGRVGVQGLALYILALGAVFYLGGLALIGLGRLLR